MGQPTPPGDMPLIEGLGPEWNEIVSAIPEDQRAVFAPKLKERISSYEDRVKQYEPFEEYRKSGITPEHINTALSTFSLLENRPREVYEAMGKHLGISTAEAKEVVEEIENDNSGDPEVERLKQQVDTLAQVMIAERQQSTQEALLAEQEAELDAEINAVKKKYGDDIPDDEIVMRMLHQDMTAEEAYQSYNALVTKARAQRPSPMVMGGGGSIPARSIDVTKTSSADTKKLVAQMLEHANNER